jgi:TetR/AcrR family transcriptional repressor of nem operon
MYLMIDLHDNEIYWWRPLDDVELDTRGTILTAAYREIHLNGFQSASLSNILARTGVTKGALYHHFPNKTQLGYAVVDEVISRRINLGFIEPLDHFDDPIEGFIQLIQQAGEAFSLTDIELGCPLSVLAQEMAPIDEGFRLRLTAIYEHWHQSIAAVLQRGQQDGLIVDTIDPQAMAVTIAAILEGSLSAAKVAQDLAKLHQCGYGLTQLLQLIRTRPRSQ